MKILKSGIEQLSKQKSEMQMVEIYIEELLSFQMLIAFSYWTLLKYGHFGRVYIVAELQTPYITFKGGQPLYFTVICINYELIL
jgi:hypothetical protein